MKKYKIITAIIVLVIFTAVFFKCSGIGVSEPALTDGTADGAVDMSPIPANSEFLKE